MSQENQNVAWVESLEELIGCICDNNSEFYQPECNTPGYEGIFPSSKRPTLWFRGEDNISYSLRPKLYRKVGEKVEEKFGRNDRKFWENLDFEETQKIDEFKLRTDHLIQGRLPADRYQWMALMQHYGTATRLLDWSEGAITAIFFALEDYFKSDNHQNDHLPCIWVLKPKLMNVLTTRYILNFNEEQIKEKSLFILKNFFSFDPPPKKAQKKHISLNISKEQIDSYCICDLVPQAVIPPYNNERIKAQAGVFTIYPLYQLNDQQGIADTYLNNLPESKKFIYKYIITHPYRVSEELKQIGVKRSLYFPELQDVSHEVEEKELSE